MNRLTAIALVTASACAPPPTNGLANANCQIDPLTLTCECVGSPVVLDLAGDGIHLTSPADGVRFALSPGHPRLWSWTTAGTRGSYSTATRAGP